MPSREAGITATQAMLPWQEVLARPGWGAHTDSAPSGFIVRVCSAEYWATHKPQTRTGLIALARPIALALTPKSDRDTGKGKVKIIPQFTFGEKNTYLLKYLGS